MKLISKSTSNRNRLMHRKLRLKWFQSRNATRLISAIIAANAIAGIASAQTTANANSGNRNWNSATTWSGGVVPNNAGATRYNVNINPAGGATVLMNSNPTINQLNVGSGSTLNLDTTRTLTIVQNGDFGSGIVTNNGSINLNGSVPSSTLRFSGSSNAQLNGSGVLTLSGSGTNARIIGSGTNTLTHGAGHTIQGNGAIGNGSLSVVNHGTIRAMSGDNLVILPRNAGAGVASFTNNNLVQAQSGGTVTINGGEFAGSGQYRAETGGNFVLRNNTNFRNTTLSGGGQIQLDSSANATWQNVTNASNTVLQTGATLSLSGGLVNTGDILLQSNGASRLTIIGTQSLTGGGTIRLTGPSALISGNATSVWTNVDNTISGTGRIGLNTLQMINQGTIQAGAGEVLTIDPRLNTIASNVTFENQGLVRAFNGGRVILNSVLGAVGGNGTYRAEANSTIELTESSRASGVTFDTQGNGRIVAGRNATMAGVRNLGNLSVINGVSQSVTNGLTNNGSIKVESTGTSTSVNFDGSQTLSGTGSLQLSGNNAGIGGSGTLTHGTGHTITGGGNIGSSSIGLINQGTIRTGAGDTITIAPSVSNGANTLVNNGTISATSGTVNVVGAGREVGGTGTWESIDGLFQFDTGVRVNSFQGQGLTEGTFRSVDTGAGTGSNIHFSNPATWTFIGSNANVELSGRNSSIRNEGVSLDSTLDRVDGGLILSNGRSMNLSGGLTQTGTTRVTGTTTNLAVNGNWVQTGGALIMQNQSTVQFNGTNNRSTGGVVKGNGTVVGNFQFGNQARLDPGFSPGRLDFDGDLTWDANGVIEFDLGSDAATSDFISVTGDLLKSGSGLFAFDFKDNGWILGQTYDLIEFNSTTFQASDFSFIANGGFDGFFGLAANDQSLQFTVTAVPEPTSLALVTIAAGCFGWRMRRRLSAQSFQVKSTSSSHLNRP